LYWERDSDLKTRPQGYRININLAGFVALRACLPESHFELYLDTSHRQIDPSVDIFSVDLRHLFHRTAELALAGLVPAAVDRGVLRAILLDAANDVRFRSEVVDVSSYADHADVRLSNGSLIRADLLLAADGAKSTLRKRLLPGCEPEPLQSVAIYGRTPLDTNALTWLPRGVIEQRFVGVTNGAGTTLALGAWYPRRLPAEAARAHVPGLKLLAPQPYVMWVLLCPANMAPQQESGPVALHQYALSTVSRWDPAAARFVREAIVPDTFRITLRAMASVRHGTRDGSLSWAMPSTPCHRPGAKGRTRRSPTQPRQFPV
jgi:hypothetical protein